MKNNGTMAYLLLLTAIIFGADATSKVDWAKLDRLSRLIQSAVAKRDLDVLVTASVETLTLTPTETNYYSMGYSYGEENVLFFNHANVLTGHSFKIPLNPFRKIQPDCIYVPNTIRGMVVLYDGAETKRSLCDVSKIYRANPTGYKPLVSRSNDAITTTKIVHSSDHQSILEAEMYVRDSPRYPYVLDPHGYTPAHVRGHTVTLLGGYFQQDKDTEMNKFVPKYVAELYHDGDDVLMDVMTDEWDHCVKCKGDPRKFAETFLHSKLDKTLPTQ